MSRRKKEVGTKLAAWMESLVMCPPECCHSISRRVFFFFLLFLSRSCTCFLLMPLNNYRTLVICFWKNAARTPLTSNHISLTSFCGGKITYQCSILIPCFFCFLIYFILNYFFNVFKSFLFVNIKNIFLNKKIF
jgi:hypothetical protein